MASLERKYLWVRALPLPKSTTKPTTFAFACLAMVHHGREHCTKPLTWQCTGSYRWCLFAKTIIMQWAPPWNALANVTEIYKLGHAYNMPSKAVEGMRCETVCNAVSEAVKRARSGKGPTFLEIQTYRYKGHSMSDPAKYRTKEEVQHYKEEDPIRFVRSTMLEKGYASEEQLKEIQNKIKEQVQAAIDFAEESPYPSDEELFTDVYQQADYPFITG